MKGVTGEYKPKYSKGIKKFAAFFVICVIASEALALYFPMLLKSITETARRLYENPGTDPTNYTPIIWQSLLVLGFIIVIFAMNFLMEFFGACYSGKYQENIRKELFEKFCKLDVDQIDQIGVARILPVIMNDSSWIKTNNRRVIQFFVYFPVTILGSLIMLFSLGWQYALIALASVPFVLIFYFLNFRKLAKIIPDAVVAYDEYFFNMKEGISGLKDIRILGKAEERSKEFERHARTQRKQALETDRANNFSAGFNAILFTLVTIGIVIYGAFGSPATAATLVVVNTAIQYVNRIWAGSHLIFTWFVDFLPRTRYTVKRLARFYAMPEKSFEGGLAELTNKSANLQFKNVSYTYPNGEVVLHKVTLNVPQNSLVAIAGGIGSGKNSIAELLLQYRHPTDGEILWGSVSAADIHGEYWRREIVSFANSSPVFIPGTIRQNIQLLAPDVSDEKILKTFKDIGAGDFLKKFGNILNFEINETNNINNSTKNVINLVRSILKPAEIYIFNQCFDHVKSDYINKFMALLQKQKKTCLFITYNPVIVKNCDIVYAMKDGKVSGMGTHKQLIQSNTAYRELQSTTVGVMTEEAIAEEKVAAEEINPIPKPSTTMEGLT